MSMKGSPINWWKEKRQSSHTGISPAANRPQTAFPWNEGHDISKIVEQAVLAAFESNAFKIAVASQVEPAFLRQQDKLNQIKTTNLNLESTLQAHVEDLPGVLKGIENQLTRLVIPDYRHSLDTLSLGQESLEQKIKAISIPDHSDELSEIVSGQARFLKTFESRLSALESRIEDLDRKTGDLDEAVVNADLRSAIRFGEISNELQDRNTTLNNSIWEVQRDLGKKTDALQRRVVGACEDMGKSIRASAETIETMRAKLDEDDVLAAVNKANSRAEFSEKTLRRSITAIQDKVSGLDTSAIPVQIAKLETIERGISDFKKEAEAARNLASVSSKFLSANTSKLDSMASAVGKMHLLVESTNEICQEVSESQETNAGSIKEDVEAVRMHVRSLDNLAVSHSRKLSDAASILTRTESAVVAFDATVISRLGDLASSTENIEGRLRPLSSHTTKLDGLESSLAVLVKDSKPQKAAFDGLAKTLSEMRANVDSVLSSHTESLSTIHQTVSNAASKDGLSTALTKLQSSIEDNLASSHNTVTKSTSEAIANHVDKLGGKLHLDFQSIKDKSDVQTDKLHTPVLEILREIRSNKALLETERAEIREEFSTTRKAIEDSKADAGIESLSIKRMIQDLQEGSKDEEILLQVESWGQNCITKQAAQLASVKELLDMSRGRHEKLQRSVEDLNEKSTEMATFLRSGDLESASTTSELGALRAYLEDTSRLDLLADITSQIFQTLSNLKHLAQQSTSSLATAYEGILAIDTKVATSSNTLNSTINDMQTSLGRDILDATSSLTTCMHDDVADLKADLGSRVSTSTNVLRSEIKAIDFSTTSNALEALKTEVANSAKNSEGMGEALKADIGTKISELRRDVKDFGHAHTTELQLHTTALEASKESSSVQSTSLTAEIAEIKKSVSPISELMDGVSSISGVVRDMDAATKKCSQNVAKMTESLVLSAKETEAQLQSLEKVLLTSGEKTLHSVQASHTLLAELQDSTSEGFAKTQSDVANLDSALSRVASTSKETESAILAGIAAELLAVRSGIDSVTSSLARAEDHDARKEGTQAEILAAVQSSSTRFNGVKEDLTRIEDSVLNRVSGVAAALEKLSSASEEAHGKTLSALTAEFQASRDTSASESKRTAELAASSSDVLRASILAEFASTKQSVVTNLNSIEATIRESKEEFAELARLSESKLNNIAIGSGERQEETIAAIRTESKTILDTLKAESEKTNAALETSFDVTGKSIISEISSARDVLSVKSDGVISNVREANQAIDKTAAENTTAHAKTVSDLQVGLRILQDVLIAETQSSKATILEDLVVVKTENMEARDVITGQVKEGNLKFEEAAANTRNISTEIIASVEAQSKMIFSTMKSELKDVRVTVEGAKEVTSAEVQKARTGLDEKIGLVELSVLAGLGGVKKELSEDIGKSGENVREAAEKLRQDMHTGFTKADTTHALTLDAIKDERRTLSDLVISESKTISESITSWGDLTIAELQQSKTSVDEKFGLFERNLSAKFGETNGMIKQELCNVGSKADKIHESTLDAIKLTSETLSNGNNITEGNLKATIKELAHESDKHHKATLESIKSACQTCLTGLDRAELDLKDSIKKLSHDLDEASHKAALNHTTTIDALTLTSTTLTNHITSELSLSTITSQNSTQSLLTSISTAQSTLETLQASTSTLSTETAAQFSSASLARKKSEKKAEANTDAILEAIRQQGKTTSSSVDAVQKVVLTGVQNLNSSLEGFIERGLEKSSADVLAVVKTGFEDVKSDSAESRNVLSGKMDSVSVTVKEEAATVQETTTAIEDNTATLRSQMESSFSDLATQTKATSTALDSYVSSLSAAIKDQGKTSQARIEAVQNHILSDFQESNTSLHTSLTALESSLAASDTKIETLTPSLKAIDAAVRVNSAAIARVDKAVLESSSQVKSEINSCISSLSASLEEDLSETGRRVRGIAEFDIPRLEILLRRQRDAVDVIGGKVVGTTKRFEEMVKAVGSGGGKGSGLGGSEVLGMSGRLRGGSNASSTRSKDSGYRMGAFEGSGGRM